MKRCPQCGHTEFLVTAHVTQDWRVDENGDYIITEIDCVDVTHWPDDDDIWECTKCGYSDPGDQFNVKEDAE